MTEPLSEGLWGSALLQSESYDTVVVISDVFIT